MVCRCEEEKIEQPPQGAKWNQWSQWIWGKCIGWGMQEICFCVKFVFFYLPLDFWYPAFDVFMFFLPLVPSFYVGFVLDSYICLLFI